MQDLFDSVPPGLKSNVTGWLVYDDSKPTPAAKHIDSFDPFDDWTLVPHDRLERFENVDKTITLDMVMANLGDGAN